MSAQALAISGYDETEFMTVDAFLSQVYGEPLPGMSLLPLRGDLRDQVETALGHRYRGLRLRYWQQGNVTTWIIDEKSKDMPMTLAVAVGPAGITHLNVLVYREPRGGEVHQAFFRQQFVGITLQDDLSLSREVDGITRRHPVGGCRQPRGGHGSAAPSTRHSLTGRTGHRLNPGLSKPALTSHYRTIDAADPLTFMVRFSSRMLRRWAYGLLLLLATVLLLILVAVGWAYGAGVRVSEPGWQQGLTLGQWRLIRDDCVAARGTDLTFEDVWPLKIKQRVLAVYDCSAGSASGASSERFPDGLPWTPPFDLQVAELDLLSLIHI